MEQQRLYFEEKMRRLEKEKALKVLHLEEEYAQLLEEKASYERKLKTVELESKTAIKKSPENTKRIKELERENKVLIDLNDQLKKSLQKLQERVQFLEKKVLDESAKDKKIKEMEVRDFLFQENN